MRPRLLALLIPILLVGCAQHRNLTFRVVDEATGAPIAGAESMEHSPRWLPTLPLFIPHRIWEPVFRSKKTTDSAGLVEYHDFSPDFKIRFTQKGYKAVMVDRVWPTVQMQSLRSDATIGEEVVDGAIVVPLRRELPESTD